MWFDLASGEVEIRWNILEQNDGGVLQIVYAGNESTDIQAQAVLEGQPEVVRLNYTEALSRPGEEYARRQGWKGQWVSLITVAMGLTMTAMTLWVFGRRRRKSQEIRRLDWLAILTNGASLTGP